MGDPYGIPDEIGRLRRNLQITEQSLSDMVAAWEGATAELVKLQAELVGHRAVSEAAAELTMTPEYPNTAAAVALQHALDEVPV